MHLVLASSSPRRRELIARLGLTPARIAAPDVDETPRKDERPRDYALRIAIAKALAVPRTADEVILAADTTVAAGRRILGKPVDEADLRRMLALLSGRRHHCLSAVAVVDTAGKLRTRLSDTTVAFKPLSPAEIDAYIASGEGMGKAGGYAIQGRAEAFVRHLQGSHSGVVGLPLFETRALLVAAGIPLPEWLYETGIGEARAALVEGDTILAARIEPNAGALRIGTVAPARLVERLSPQLALIRLAPADRAPAQAGALNTGRPADRTAFLPSQEHGSAPGREAILDRPPSAATLGQSLLIEIVREAIPEPGRPKLPRARLAVDGAIECDGPALLARITATGHPVRHCRPHEPDALEAAGWSEVLEEARTGAIVFAGGALRLSPTPAMALFDVDGPAPLGPLAVAAAEAVAAAIERHDIGGSIGIDFPTLAGKAERQAVAEAIDAALAHPFERTAVNGFGFLQIVRPRPRASLPEILRADPVAAAARAVLRALERTPPGTSNAVRLPAAVIARIDAEGWRAELERRTGVVARLEPPQMDRQ